MKKAKLTILLKADDVIIAEVENSKLWQQVLSVIHSDEEVSDAINIISTKADKINKNSPSILNTNTTKEEESLLAKFAKTIDITKQQLEGSLSPTESEPYLHVDKHCYAAMKKATPSSGSGSISDTALVATLLALWIEVAKLNIQATQKQVAAILKIMGLRDHNASRAIRNTSWLLPRAGGTILINPAHIDVAQNLAKKFCSKNWTAKDNSE